jgi:D-proline reductase (dithiol) PrdB
LARIEDIPQPTRDNVVALECTSLEARPFVSGPPLSQRRVSIVSSAALFARGDAPFQPGSAEFRELPASLAADEILMSHVSINYDRTGWQRDINTIFPIDRLRELAAEGVIGSVADVNFSVMGSTDPKLMEETADSISARMKRDRIDAVLFSPV